MESMKDKFYLSKLYLRKGLAFTFIILFLTSGLFSNKKIKENEFKLSSLNYASQSYGIETTFIFLPLAGIKVNTGFEYGSKDIAVFTDLGLATSLLGSEFGFQTELGFRFYNFTIDYSFSGWRVNRENCCTWKAKTQNYSFGLQIPLFNKVTIWLKIGKSFYLDINTVYNDLSGAVKFMINHGWNYEVRLGKSRINFTN